MLHTISPVYIISFCFCKIITVMPLLVALWSINFLGNSQISSSALDTPKMVLNTTRSKVYHLYGTSFPSHCILSCFQSISPFELYATLWKVHRLLSLNDFEHYKFKEHHNMYPESQISVRFSLPRAITKMLKISTRGPYTLGLCLTGEVGMTLAIFCILLSKSHGCRLNQLKHLG